MLFIYFNHREIVFLQLYYRKKLTALYRFQQNNICQTKHKNILACIQN
jgi:hypothetical protein